MESELRQLRQRPFRQRFFGDKAFYMMVLGIALPMMLQNGISTFVSLLDNIMVGRIGTEAMSGVSIANQLFFVYNISLFGGMSGAGIFTVQYFGKGDMEGLRGTVRYKLWLGLILTVIGMLLLIFFQKPLVNLYLHDTDNAEALAETLEYACSYINILLISLPAFALTQIYSSTLRECGETKIPMYASVVAVAVNCVLNYILIFGKFGFPVLGVNGAAIATVISRYIEMGINVFWAHTHKEKQAWAHGLFRTMRIPAKEVQRIFLRGTPLLLNEVVWSTGMAFISQCYSIRGLDVIAANNIASNITQLTNIIYFCTGNTIGIIVGQLLGAGKMVEAKDMDNKLIMFSCMLALISTGLLLIIAPLFPMIYNTSEEIRTLATNIMRVLSIFCVQSSFLHCSYYTIRSGGKTVITFLFDSVLIWVLSIPTAFILSRYTNVDVLFIFAAVELANIGKVVLGYIMLRKNIWIHNIVS